MGFIWQRRVLQFLGVLDKLLAATVSWHETKSFSTQVKLVFDMTLHSLLVLCLVSSLVFEGCAARATGNNDNVTGSVDGDGMTRYKYVNSMYYISCWLPAEYA
ncbi:hypothetical protein LSAT2_010204 [Lamellibrachia satsuma]|nr:hypothetical protein LSAT2_010204 [Lamellibrachia satsuma]